MGTKPHYNEALLQWLWKNRYLQNCELKTVNDEKVVIHHPGYLNDSDGPDFTNARITIGKLMWHGDVEIHWTPGDWFAHHHHTDKNYNRVILHVVYDGSGKTVVCQDDSTPPTLQMKPFLSKPLQYFFRDFRQPNRLPCAGNIASVPERILQEQFDEAHQAYFEQKVNDLLQFYDATLPLSKAWLRMLVISLFDGLGISHNREPMRKLAIKILDEIVPKGKDFLTENALKIAGIKPENSGAPFQWKRKGSRPANHPNVRIRQGCEMLNFITGRSFSWWLRTDIKKGFTTMCNKIETRPGIGSHQSEVLFGTVWLPAFYLLGDLTGTARLRTEAGKMWNNQQLKLPKSIAAPFKEADIPPHIFEKKPGTVYQFRAYCKPHKCEHCKVFNYVISS